MTTPPCAVCAAAMTPLHRRAVDYITGDAFEVWACASCGAGRTVPTPPDLGQYYPSRYRDYNPAVASVMAVLYRRRVRRWSQRFAQPGRAFEMGCGNGQMLATLRGLGWQVLGSERTEAAAEIARRQFGLDVIAGGLDALDPAARFDLIMLNQVLEHLDDPAPTLTRLAGLLAPGGKLVIGVPNFASWQASFGGATWFHLDVPRHLHHYSPRALALLLERHGLVVDALSFASPEHDPYGWVQSTLNRLDPGRPNRLTRLLMRLDRPDPVNLLHLGLGGLIGAAAVPLALASWIARRGALVEIIATSDARKAPRAEPVR